MEEMHVTVEAEEQFDTQDTYATQNKFGAFLERNFALFFAPLITFFVYMTVLAAYGAFPFGDIYTVASYDLSAQICPFIEHLFDVWDGKSTLTYSYAVAGGADVTGTFLYFFISPFSFLFLICGEGMVAQASSFVMACKVAAVAFAGTWFAKKQFKRIPDYLCIAVGMVYAYCGYMFVANTYINWVDFLIYMPFCAAAFRRFVQTGGFLPFAVSMAVCIYTCFSIACFSMFTVFPVLIFYGLLCVEKSKRNPFLAKLCMAFVVAVLLAMPVLLPALSAYINSGRGTDGGLFSEVFYGFEGSWQEGLTAFDKSAFSERFLEALYKKWSYILADGAFIALTIIWFCQRGLKDRFARFMLVAGALCLLPAVVDEAMLLMNMGSYMSYALRFGFLNSLYFLGGACLALENLCFMPRAAYDGALLYCEEKLPLVTEKDGGRYAMNPENEGKEAVAETAKKGVKIPRRVCIATVGFAVAGVVAFVFLIWLTVAGNYKRVWSGFVKDEALLATMDYFSSRLAHSLGGAEITGLLCGIVVLLFAAGGVLARKKMLGTRLLSYVLIAVLAAQTLFYNNMLVAGNCSTQHADLAEYRSICEVLNEREDGYFRVKDYGVLNDKGEEEEDAERDNAVTANAPFMTGGNAFSVFSSVIDADNFVMYNLFGYGGNGTNNLKSSHSSTKYNRAEAFGDSFLGYKYFVATAAEKEKIDADNTLGKYLMPVTESSASGEEKQLREGDFYVYENTLVFPSAYRVQGGEGFAFVKPNEANSAFRMENHKALYAYLRGQELDEMAAVNGWNDGDRVTVEAVRELSGYLHSRKAESVVVGAGRIDVCVQAEVGESLLLNFVASKGYRVYVNGRETELIENDLKLLCVALEEGTNEVSFVYSSPYVAWLCAGVLLAIFTVCGLIAAAFVRRYYRRKTEQGVAFAVADKAVRFGESAVAWLGIALAVAVVGVFMIFPTSTWIVKTLCWMT